ncbi:MAG: DNA recombination protein RmuC [Elusimicrobiota bacterium]|nr:DNA recombination protein RmuC [Elusimicrobiota bacterium]
MIIFLGLAIAVLFALLVSQYYKNRYLLSWGTRVEETQKIFTDAFANLANRIFEEKSEKFTKQNKENLTELLNPLKNDIEKFKHRIEETDEKNRNSHTSLIQQIKSMEKLNKQISDEAGHLAKALKGDVKMQGNWGETILERLLEISGLVKGVEYIPQGEGQGLTGEDGKHLKPDFIIKLPDDRFIIVDAKVSLVSYEKLVNAETQEQKEEYLKELNSSIRAHIVNLESKHYQTAKGLNTPDFVLLFMPIEGGFSLSMQSDGSLFNFALEKKIVIVSPSTLHATLKTIEYIWKQDKQTKNAIEIARQSGALYDKFVGFLKDFDKVGKQLATTQKTYDEAHKKISSGKGNLISRAEKIRELGAGANKNIPGRMLESGEKADAPAPEPD